MTILICDRCKHPEEESGRFPLFIVHLRHERPDYKSLDWWLGKKQEIDLCEYCIKEIWESARNPQVEPQS
jgi:hypothetical protein